MKIRTEAFERGLLFFISERKNGNKQPLRSTQESATIIEKSRGGRETLKKYRIVFSDIDGTLLDEEHRLYSQTIRAPANSAQRLSYSWRNDLVECVAADSM